MVVSLWKEIKLLAKHSAVYSLGTFMQRIVALLLLPVYTRFLTPHDYGIKELVGLSVDVIGILLATAIGGAFYRFYFKYDSPEERNEVVSTAFISIGTISFIAGSCLAFATREMAGLILDDPSLYYFFMIAFTSLWFQTLNNLSYNYLKANKQSLKFISFSFMKMIIGVSLNIYFVCILHIGVLGILVSNLISVFVITIFLTIPLLFKVGIRFSKLKLKEMLRFGLPLVPAQFGAFIVHLSDRFFIKEYCSITDAGLYSLGYRFGTLPGTFISDPFNQIFWPRRLEAYKEKNAEYVFGKIFIYFLMLIFFVGLMVAVLSKDILLLMADEQFWAAYQVIPIIVLSNIIHSLFAHLAIGVLISKKTKYFTWVDVSNGIFVLTLNFLLIPRFGIWGAAWATVASRVYRNILTYYFSSKFFKIYFELFRLIKLILVSGIVYFLCQTLHFQSVFVSLLIKIFFILVCYPLGLFIVQFFSDEEKEKIVYSIRHRTLSGWM